MRPVKTELSEKEEAAKKKQKIEQLMADQQGEVAADDKSKLKKREQKDMDKREAVMQKIADEE